MSRWGKFILLGAALAVLPGLAGPPDPVQLLTQKCLKSTLDAALFFEPTWGKDPSVDERFPGCQLAYINKGTNGTVYRVLPETGPSWPLKAFRSFRSGYSRETGDFSYKRSALEFREENFQALTFFRQKQEQGVYFGFIIPKVRRVDHPPREGKEEIDRITGIAYEEDILGRDVKSLLMDETLDEGLRKKVREEYGRLLAQFESQFIQHCEGRRGPGMDDPEVMAHDRSLNIPFLLGNYVLREERSTQFGANLHLMANQIVVDARTFKFYLVDPN